MGGFAAEKSKVIMVHFAQIAVKLYSAIGYSNITVEGIRSKPVLFGEWQRSWNSSVQYALSC